MKEVLQNLANLQYIDSRIDELKRLRGDLPEEVLDIEMDISRLQNKIKNLDAHQIELKQEKGMLELEIKDAEALTSKYEDQQLTVRNNREYDALTKEIESQKQNIENAKSRLEEIAILLEEAEKEFASSKDQLAETEVIFAKKKDNLETLVESTKTEEAELLNRRSDALGKVDVRFLKNYERLRNGLNNGIAVVAMERGSCLGMMLPPQIQVEVKKKNKIVIDENSGRIVLDPEFFAEAKKTLTI